ncbi:hypothetical protein OROMI_016266 [Orobanche minor]
MARDSCLTRVTAGMAVGGAVGGAVGAVYGTYEAIRYKWLGYMDVIYDYSNVLKNARGIRLEARPRRGAQKTP